MNGRVDGRVLSGYLYTAVRRAPGIWRRHAAVVEATRFGFI
jgi:hypothetical protein